MIKENRKYWFFRSGRSGEEHEVNEELYNEMNNGRLHQGWGFSINQALPNGSEIDKGSWWAYNKVKKGDILIAPIFYKYSMVAILEATDDFDDLGKGYRFEAYNPDDKLYGYGHIHSVRYLKEFYKGNKFVDAALRSSCRSIRRRFGPVQHLGDNIELLLKQDADDLVKPTSYSDRLDGIVNDVFHQKFESIENDIADEIKNKHAAAEWEDFILAGIESIGASQDNLLRAVKTSNKKEKGHGTDIFIFFPSPIEHEQEYVIAIQIKDHWNKVNNDVVNQICRADDEFNASDKEGVKLIDKILVITQAEPDENIELIDYAKSKGVKIMFREDFERLLRKIARNLISLEVE